MDINNAATAREYVRAWIVDSTPHGAKRAIERAIESQRKIHAIDTSRGRDTRETCAAIFVLIDAAIDLHNGRTPAYVSDGSVAARQLNRLDVYVAALVVATIDYDASGDHVHAGSPIPGDCVRCNVVASLPNTAAAEIAQAKRGGRGR